MLGPSHPDTSLLSYLCQVGYAATSLLQQRDAVALADGYW